MSEFFFDIPWFVPVILAAAGGVAFVAANARQQTRVMQAGATAMLLAVVLTLVSYFVDTPRESAIANAQGIVQAVEDRDWPRFTELIGDRATVIGLLDAETTLRFVQDGTERADIQTLTIRRLEAQQQPPNGVSVDMTVISTARDAGPGETSWRLLYGIDAEGQAVLLEVEPTNLPETVTRMLDRMRRGQ